MSHYWRTTSSRYWREISAWMTWQFLCWWLLIRSNMFPHPKRGYYNSSACATIIACSTYTECVVWGCNLCLVCFNWIELLYRCQDHFQWNWSKQWCGQCVAIWTWSVCKGILRTQNLFCNIVFIRLKSPWKTIFLSFFVNAMFWEPRVGFVGFF